MKLFFRRLHRWLGLLIAVQIIAWMGSGFYFALFPIESIRGEHLAVPREAIEAKQLAGSTSPDQAWMAVADALGPDASIQSVNVSVADGVLAYTFEGLARSGAFVRRVHATDGNLLPMIDQDTARRIAADSVTVQEPVEAVQLLDNHQPGSEYRGRRLPLWRVNFAGPDSLSVYVDAWSGEVSARRTGRWRIFDFLWMLHIMDFSERDNFNTPLLQASALLGLILALSGIVYWGLTTRLFRRRRND